MMGQGLLVALKSALTPDVVAIIYLVCFALVAGSLSWRYLRPAPRPANGTPTAAANKRGREVAPDTWFYLLLLAAFLVFSTVQFDQLRDVWRTVTAAPAATPSSAPGPDAAADRSALVQAVEQQIAGALDGLRKSLAADHTAALQPISDRLARLEAQQRDLASVLARHAETPASTTVIKNGGSVGIDPAVATAAARRLEVAVASAEQTLKAPAAGSGTMPTAASPSSSRTKAVVPAPAKDRLVAVEGVSGLSQRYFYLTLQSSSGDVSGFDYVNNVKDTQTISAARPAYYDLTAGRLLTLKVTALDSPEVYFDYSGSPGGAETDLPMDRPVVIALDRRSRCVVPTAKDVIDGLNPGQCSDPQSLNPGQAVQVTVRLVK